MSCYRSTHLLGGHNRFVLSTSGHIAAMVNPPGNEKARYQVAKECPEDPQEWLRRAGTGHGSWWPDYASWLAERCGDEKAARTSPAVAGWRRSATRQERTSMITETSRPGRS